jgi:hypothetical protein
MERYNSVVNTVSLALQVCFYIVVAVAASLVAPIFDKLSSVVTQFNLLLPALAPFLNATIERQ